MGLFPYVLISLMTGFVGMPVEKGSEAIGRMMYEHRGENGMLYSAPKVHSGKRVVLAAWR